MLCMLGTASADWQRLPSSDVPINFANKAILGAKIQSSSSIGNASALLSDMSAPTASIPSGSSNVVITLGAQEVVEDVSFINEGVSGTVTVSSSTDLNEWTSLAQASFQSNERLVSLKFAGAQAKYVRISFNASNGASIRSLKISGAAMASDYKSVPVKESKAAVEVNLASGAQGSRPIYMYPTPVNAGDNEGSRQIFRFPRTTERFRTVIYDLGNVRTIKKFNATYSRVPTRVDVFAFEQLPEKKDWRGKLTLDPSIFDATPVTASGEDASGKGQIQLSPSKPVKARYIALRFEPNYNKRGVAGLDSPFENFAAALLAPYSSLAEELGLAGRHVQAAGSGGDFTVIEVGVGGTSQSVLISKDAIKQVQQQLGAGATEADAIAAILAALGLTPADATPGGETGPDPDAPGGGNNSGPITADPNAPLNSAALSALGLSAYRGGGTGGTGPFEGDGGGTSGNNGGGGGGSSGGGGGGRPIIIVPTVPTSP